MGGGVSKHDRANATLTTRKLARRKQLAALPVGEKLRMLEEMVAETRVISATRPPKSANPVRKGWMS